MTIGGTPVPKREIIAVILHVIPPEQIREILKIQAQTDLQSRLDDFTKIQLLEVIQSAEEGKNAIEEAKANYPLSTAPTLYMISVSSWPDRRTLVESTEILAERMSRAAVWFGSDRSVRSVYMIAAAREFHAHSPFVEVPLVYEKKIEYTVADPESEAYGEVEIVYSLEKSLVWYSEEYKHALLLCGDFLAVKPIISYGKAQLGLRWQLPFLSEAMLQRMTEGANPRMASFSRLEEDPADDLDVQTMTISDEALGASRSFRRLAQDRTRHQTSGFYSSHPDLVYGGLGISRQYGRIWTPARLRKDSLLALSVNLIHKTEEELVREAEINLGGFIAYYRNTPITLARKKVRLSQRFLIEELAKAVITARRSRNQETVLELEFISLLIAQYVNLDLAPTLEAQCENCGSYLLRCPICLSPYHPIRENQHILFECPIHHEQRIHDDQTVNCQCGANLEITFSSDIRIFPGAELLKTLHEFLSVLENQHYDGSFLITGTVFRLIPRRSPTIIQYPLHSFRAWRVRAHFHQRQLSDERINEYQRTLSRIREKCSRNGGHPTKEMCDGCMKEAVKPARIKEGIDICLPRIFGYAIDENFDGIHHGHEVADIRYPDVVDETGEQLHLAIHLKSRERPKSRGLGRTVSSVKGLYTQYCYSAYLAARREVNLNVIGISIPNVLSGEVVENFQYLADQLGYPLVILSEGEWVKILDAAIEKAEIGS